MFLEVRKALEELAVNLACDRMTKMQIRELKEAAKEFEEILKIDDVTKIAEVDVKFHDVIFMATDNERLIQLLNNFREQMYRYRVEHLKKKEVHSTLIAEHQEIIQNIEKRKEKRSG